LSNPHSQDSECPVCYESLSGTERTLSCGHVFCHDCLVKTLVSINRDGVIRDTIICPVCRHLTFIKKQQEVGVPLAPGKKRARKEHHHEARRASGHSSSPNSQIFIISAQGRPMADEDAVSLDTMPVVLQPNRRRRRVKICTTARCLVVLLVIFTLMAMVAATLPWIILHSPTKPEPYGSSICMVRHCALLDRHYALFLVIVWSNFLSLMLS
uniref:RING-type domain-containing protein n=1 Tax=Oncorhynchus mykiss TaxID=8022 RepID=A0A8K9WSP8_ONCMY